MVARMADALLGDGIHVPTWLAKIRVRKFACDLCFDRFEVTSMYTLSCVASHRYCYDCVRGHVEAGLRGGSANIRCPESSTCKYVITIDDVKQLFGPESDAALQFERFQLNGYLANASGMIKCPGLDCDMYMEVPSAADRECCNCLKCGAKLLFPLQSAAPLSQHYVRGRA